MTIVRAAVVQAAAIGFDLEAGLDKVERLASEASTGGVQIVVFPEAFLSGYAKGVQIYCASTADGRKTWLSTMRHVAMEGRCFVLSCNQFTRRRDFPSDIPNALVADPDDVLSSGGSCIIGPLVEVLAGPARDGEETGSGAFVATEQ